MDLFCPHCTRRVTVPDNQAGQVTNCPLCLKQFMAPSLAPPPIAPKPPAPAMEGTFGLGPAPASSPLSAAPKPTTTQPIYASPPVTPPPPGEYTRSCVCNLSAAWLAFVAPVCVLLIFVLSFFTWHGTETTTPASLWGLAFSQQSALFVAYTLVVFLTSPLVFAALIFDKNWVPTPPQIAPVLTFKNLLVGLLLTSAFLLLCYDYLNGNLLEKSNPIAWPMKLAIRLHFLAVVASFAMFWLHWRKRSNLPTPKCEVHW
jgi:hypothetical protein